MQYFLIVILIALSAFFSGSEISYASLNGMRMKNAAEKLKLPIPVLTSIESGMGQLRQYLE